MRALGPLHRMSGHGRGCEQPDPIVGERDSAGLGKTLLPFVF